MATLRAGNDDEEKKEEEKEEEPEEELPPEEEDKTPGEGMGGCACIITLFTLYNHTQYT